MPVGWEPKASGIYFVPTNKADTEIVVSITGGPKCIKLGATFDEAVRTFDKLIVARRDAEREVVEGTVGELCDRARRHYLPKIKNNETRDWRERHIEELDRVFGARLYARNVYEATKARPGTYVVAMDIQRHIDENAPTRPAAVNRAVQTWRIVWKEARRRWGLTEYNPCEGLQPNDETPRDTLPDDRKHFFKVYRALDPPMRFVLALGRYYGRRPGEARRIELPGIQEDGVHTIRGKRARELILEWDDYELKRRDGTVALMPGRLRKMVARAMRWRESVIRPQVVWKNGRRRPAPRVVSTKLLVNRRGRALSKTGFTSAFRRAMAEVGLVEMLGEVVLPDGRKVQRTRRAFNPNDTRAKRASTLKKVEATEVLAHDEDRTTEVHYRRGPIVITVPRDSELADSRKAVRNSRKVGTDRS